VSSSVAYPSTTSSAALEKIREVMQEKVREGSWWIGSTCTILLKTLEQWKVRLGVVLRWLFVGVVTQGMAEGWKKQLEGLMKIFPSVSADYFPCICEALLHIRKETEECINHSKSSASCQSPSPASTPRRAFSPSPSSSSFTTNVLMSANFCINANNPLLLLNPLPITLSTAEEWSIKARHVVLATHADFIPAFSFLLSQFFGLFVSAEYVDVGDIVSLFGLFSDAVTASIVLSVFGLWGKERRHLVFHVCQHQISGLLSSDELFVQYVRENIV
jgi:hypothetical protein